MSAEPRTGLPSALVAADGLRLEPAAEGVWRVAWRDHGDWWGPLTLGLGGEPAPARPAGWRAFDGRDALGRFRGLEPLWEDPAFPLRTSVRAYAEQPVLVFRLEAPEGAEALATGSFERPAVAWPWLRPAQRSPDGAPTPLRAYGHQYTEFAFPTFADGELSDFFVFPHRPAVMAPLWLNAPDASLLLGPLGDFHDQVIGIPVPGDAPDLGVRCGWHGDLAGVPAGFATEIALWAGPAPRVVLEAWAAHLREAHGTRRLSRYADAHLARLSYWTDNGATYWYRTEPGLDVAQTLERVHRSFVEQRVPIGAYELDSWFYPHEIPRAIGSDNPEHVPPSGALLWEERDDALPDGIPDLRRRLGGGPLVVHARHFSSLSPYWQSEPAWIDGDRAHPQDPAFFGRLVARAAGWGVETIEQDWLVEMYLGVRGLRERPGRAAAWQRAFDRAVAEHGMTALWCMATPADFLNTVTLERVASIRTSGDYRYLAANPAHWVRFLYTNALARALGLHPFKDVFLSNPAGRDMDGDPYAEAEAMLAALSSGPVGLGDRIGCTDRGVVMRTCREDGVLVKPDVPLAAIDRCLRRDCHFEPELLVGECWSDHPAGRWSYVAALNAWRGERELAGEVPLAELGAAAPSGPVVAYDWRTAESQLLGPGDALSFRLAAGAWSLRLLCPLLCGDRLALFGDTTRYASLGDRRLAVREAQGALRVEVYGPPGERVTLAGWCDGAVAAEQLLAGGPRTLEPEPRDGGGFRLAVEIPATGAAELRIAP